jgi:Arc/MetJ-type ribon-helix-helix transcriptional regulator
MSGTRLGLATLVVPGWYHLGMTIQIAVRIDDKDVGLLDEMVTAGRAASRADAVRKLIAAERRHQMALHDAAIYAQDGSDPDMTALAAWASRRSLNID